MSEPQQLTFSIQKLYVKDMSLEVPNGPGVFFEQATPQIGIELNTGAKGITNTLYESVLTVRVTAREGEKVVFLVEVAQAGIFEIGNAEGADLNGLLGIACPTVLFPYARETVSAAIGRAGFPPVILNPVNFESLYAEQMNAQEAAQNN
ncbi:MAG TPA: protein-export chaperone SecB [Burkholderiales bacterium]|nr:protein-export chaperone SecB [Pseudomonadota bacterium]HVC49683.1 protein-export chaperone SecB [Burkholderiales bacterium]